MEKIKVSRRRTLTKFLPKESVARNALKGEIEKLWKQLDIPKEDQACFKKYYFDCSNAKASLDVLKAQISLLEKYKAKTFIANEAVERREKYLKELKLFLNKEKLGLKEFAEEVPDKLINLRNSTIAVLSRIRKWRKLMWNPNPFIWNSTNYILKIGKDYEDFLESIMFVKLQIFVADFIFFVPQASMPCIEVSEEDAVYQKVVQRLIPREDEKLFEYLS